ncbi:outer membrane protein [Halorhodospira halophila]|uniref:outer membrane protein n=1 Tax=Halorhodospira halophila TaxID=1053 RepID=UPI001F5CED2E|nr:outer membrane beta-barrel protein [Halorhodospira halophila]MBK5935703.1 hypothetical protein [Halorhodospira halophila]
MSRHCAIQQPWQETNVKGLRLLGGSTLSLLIAASPSLAGASSFSGPYLALGAGVLTSQTYETKLRDTNGDRYDTTYGQEDWASKFDIVFGFGERIGDLYLATEFNYTVGNLDGEIGSWRDNQGERAELSVDAGDGLGVSVRVGRMFTDTTLGYAKVTYQQRELEFTGNYRLNNSSGHESEDEDFAGFGVGLGFEYVPPDSPLGIRAEAMRIDFGDETFSDDFKVDLVEHSFNLFASYHF